MSSGKMDASMLSSGLETISNVSKIIASTTAQKMPETKTFQSYREGEKLDQPHNQTVEVKVGSEPQQKPIVLHEKKETHIHKPFPEGRELSERECEVEKLRLQLEAEAKKDELNFRMAKDDAYRKERRELEEQQRRDRERREAETRKSNRRFLIGAGILCGIAAGLGAYAIYTDSRRTYSSGLALPKPGEEMTVTYSKSPINAEGSVK